MAYYQNQFFIEYKDNSWKVAVILDNKVDFITIGHNGREIKLLPSDKNLSKFRKNTSKLQGSKEVLETYNFLDFVALNSRIQSFITGLETKDPDEIINFITGHLYFAIYSMQTLDYQTYSQYSNMFIGILQDTLKLFCCIFRLETLCFTERNLENMTSITAYGNCWPEMSDILKLLFDYETNGLEYYYDSNFLRLNEKLVFFNKIKANFREYSLNLKSISKFFRSGNCLRFVYFLEVFYNIFDDKYEESLANHFVNYLMSIENKDFCYYDSIINQRFLDKLIPTSNSNYRFTSEILKVNLKVFDKSTSLQQKIKIISDINKTVATNWNNEVKEIIKGSKLYISIISHEELLKKSEEIYKKLIQESLINQSEIQEILNELKEEVIAIEFFSLFAKLVNFIPKNLCQLIFEEVIKRFNSNYEGILIILGQSMILSKVFSVCDLIETIKIKNDEQMVSNIICSILLSKNLRIYLLNFIQTQINKRNYLKIFYNIVKKLKNQKEDFYELNCSSKFVSSFINTFSLPIDRDVEENVFAFKIVKLMYSIHKNIMKEELVFLMNFAAENKHYFFVI